MYEKRKNRSDSYQHLLLELVCSHDMLESFSNQDSIQRKLNPYKYDEEVADLEDELKVEFWKIVGSLLTPRQKEVIRLYADGYTQMEIAKMLGVNQSSITKSLNGNVDYKNGKRVYGGAIKRLKRLIDLSPRIVEILKRIAEKREEEW